MSRIFIVGGLVLVGIGLLIRFGVPIGRLPGDILIRREHTTFYFPVVTCIVVSIVLWLLTAIFRR